MKMNLRFFSWQFMLGLAILAVFQCNPVFAKIMYVAKGGAGTQDGLSWTNAAPSIIGVLTSTTITAGDTVYVKAETYDNEGNWNMGDATVLGTSGNPITVVSYDAAGTTPQPGAVKLTGDFYRYWPAGNYFQVFDGLDFAAPDPLVSADFIEIRGTDITFKHCLFHGTADGSRPTVNFDDNLLPGTSSFIECLFYDIHSTGNNGQIFNVIYGPALAGQIGNIVIDKCTFIGNPSDATQTSGGLIRVRNDNRVPPDTRYPGTINLTITNSLFVDAPTYAVADDQYVPGILNVTEDHNGFFNCVSGTFHTKSPNDPTDKVNVDPLFVNPGSLDYRLQVGSPMIQAGTGGANIGWDQTGAVPVELSMFALE